MALPPPSWAEHIEPPPGVEPWRRDSPRQGERIAFHLDQYGPPDLELMIENGYVAGLWPLEITRKGYTYMRANGHRLPTYPGVPST